MTATELGLLGEELNVERFVDVTVQQLLDLEKLPFDCDEVPEACLGYPDYKKNRGANLFAKGSRASKFYKDNGYWKLKVYKAGEWSQAREGVYKYFKEVKEVKCA